MMKYCWHDSCRTVLCEPTAVGKREFLGNIMSNVRDTKGVLYGSFYRHTGYAFRGSEGRKRGDALSPSRYSVSCVAVSESPGNRDVAIIAVKNYPDTTEVCHDSSSSFFGELRVHRSGGAQHERVLRC